MKNKNKMRNKLAIYLRSAVLLCCLMALPKSVFAQNNVIDEVIWVVGDEIILKSDVESLRLQYLIDGKKIDGNPYCVIPEQIAIQKLFLNQAKLDSIEVSESAIIRQVDMYMAEYLKMFNSKEKMEEVMNKTTSQIRRDLRNSLREGETVKMVQDKLLGDIAVDRKSTRLNSSH